MKKSILLVFLFNVHGLVHAQPTAVPASGYIWVKTQSNLPYNSGPISTVPDYNSGNTNFGLSGDSDPLSCASYCGGACDGEGTISDKLFGDNNPDIPFSATCEQRALNLTNWNNTFPNSGVSNGASSGTVYLPVQANIAILQSVNAPGTGAGGTNNRAWIIGGNGPGNTSRFNCKIDFDISWNIPSYSVTGTSGLQTNTGFFEGGEPGGGFFNQVANWTADFGSSFGANYPISPSTIGQNGGDFEVIFVSTSSATVINREFGNADGMIAHDPGMEGRASLTVLYDVWEIQAVMPVTLSYFDVSNHHNTNVLIWETVSEVNNKGFNIEKSVDGKQWSKVGFVEGYGNSNSKRKYLYHDDARMNTRVYYRLAQEDLDGKIAYSPVRFLSLDSSGEISMYPNPSSNLLTFAGIQNGKIEIFDIKGILQLTTEISRDFQEVDVQNLSKGIYHVRILDNESVKSKRFIKE